MVPARTLRPLIVGPIALAAVVGTVAMAGPVARNWSVEVGDQTPTATPTAASVTSTPTRSATPTTRPATPTKAASPMTSPTKAVPTKPAPPKATTPAITKEFIPYSATRKAQMAAYAKRHYGIDSATLAPRTIVLHFTATDSVSSVVNTFAANTPTLGEGPGTCAHFIVEKSGKIDQLVPTNLMCRHTIGLNHRAIGIEVMQSTDGHSSAWADQQILARTAQINALLALVRDLQRQYDISSSNVVGHGTANSARGFKDLLGWRNDHTDWGPAAMETFHARLAAGSGG